jgi:hypothetical protein
MALHHKRAEHFDQQTLSERVQRRSTELLRQLEPASVKRRLEGLLAATRGEGEDVAFLDRWGYDEEQRTAIANAIEAVAE